MAEAVAGPEPVTTGALRPVTRPLLTQRWCDLAFLHWPVAAGAAGLPPPAERPVSVLSAPGVPVRMGIPRHLRPG